MEEQSFAKQSLPNQSFYKESFAQKSFHKKSFEEESFGKETFANQSFAKKSFEEKTFDEQSLESSLAKSSLAADQTSFNLSSSFQEQAHGFRRAALTGSFRDRPTELSSLQTSAFELQSLELQPAHSSFRTQGTLSGGSLVTSCLRGGVLRVACVPLTLGLKLLRACIKGKLASA